MRTGNYVYYDALEAEALKYNVPLVRRRAELESLSQSNVSSFYATVRSQTGLEGFVFRFANGTMYKVKTLWYFAKSKSLDLFKNPNERHKWAAVLSGSYDDVKPFLSEAYKRAVDRFSAVMFEKIAESAERLLGIAIQARHAQMQRKQFSEIVVRHQGVERKLLWKYYVAENDTSIGEAVEDVKKAVLDHVDSKQKFEQVHHLAGKISFLDFIERSELAALNREIPE
jgi:hypothetical protein